MKSNTLSAADRSSKFAISRPEGYNTTSNQNEDQKKHKFKTYGKISEEERIEIIQRGFQLNKEGKITLKKYYESTEEHSLFQFKGYSTKYGVIRNKELFKNLRNKIQ